MKRRFLAVCVWSAAAIAACKGGGTPTAVGTAAPETTVADGTSISAPTASASRSAPAPPSSVTDSTQPSAQDSLPPLKPVTGKPFPEGVTQDVLCEAIHSQEPDLWVRFGHMIPMYFTGALYVLKAGKDKEAAIVRYIKEDYIHPHYPQLASCGNRTLLYIRNMMEGPEYRNRPYGRVHLSGELERHLNVTTIEIFRLVHDNERLSEYCRQDAELCEQLVKLDGANMGQGLCSLALYFGGVDEPDAATVKRCLQLPAKDKVCAYYSYGSGPSRTRDLAEQQWRCEASLRKLLRPTGQAD